MGWKKYFRFCWSKYWKKKLKKLEKEEENRILNDEGNINWISEEYYIPQSEEEKYKKIKNKIALYKIKKGLNKSSHNILPRKFKPIPLSEIEKELTSRGVDKKIINQASETTRSLSRKRSLSKNKSKTRSISESRNLLEVEQREGKKDSLLVKKEKEL